MESCIEKLFKYLKESVERDLSQSETISGIKKDEELLKASNSYCVQCGSCCNTRCVNKEKRDGLVFCLLHHEEAYVPKRSVADYSALNKKHNPGSWSKPAVCHTYGPHIGFLAVIHYLQKGKELKEIGTICEGGLEMVLDFKKFLNFVLAENR